MYVKSRRLMGRYDIDASPLSRGYVLYNITYTEEVTAERKRSDETTPVLTDTLALYTSTVHIYCMYMCVL